MVARSSVKRLSARVLAAAAVVLLGLAAGACVGLLGLDDFADETGPGDAGVDGGVLDCPPWSRRLATGVRNGTMVAADRLITFVVGEDGTVEVEATDPCDGSTLGHGSFELDGHPEVGLGAALQNGSMFVVGGSATPPDGGTDSRGLLAFVAEGVADGFELLDASISQASAGPDEIWSLAAASSGALWVLGQRAWRRWLLRFGTGGEFCDIEAADSMPAGRVLLAEPGGTVYAFHNLPASDAGLARDGLRLERYEDPVWEADSSCGHPASDSAEHNIGAGWAILSSAVRVGQRAFIAGALSTNPDNPDPIFARGYLAEIDLTDLSVPPPFVTWDGTFQGDALTLIASDERQLFVGALTNWINPELPRSHLVMRYPIEWSSSEAGASPEPVAAWEQSQLRELESLAVDPGAGRGLYLLVLTANDEAVVMRCDKEQGCPELP